MSENMSNVERGLWRIAELGARCSQQSAAGSRGPLWAELEHTIAGLEAEFEAARQAVDTAPAQVRTLEGHSAPVGGLAYSPDGKFLASGDQNGLKLWNAATLEEVRAVKTPANQLAFTPDSQALFAAQTIEQRAFSYLWDIGEPMWSDVVLPVVNELRALPDPERPRTFRQRQDMLVFEK